MYSKNFSNADDQNERLTIPKNYDGSAFQSESANDRPSCSEAPPERDVMRDIPPPPPVPVCPKRPPSGIFERLVGDDILLFAAAMLLILRDDNDILSLGIILLLIFL